MLLRLSMLLQVLSAYSPLPKKPSLKIAYVGLNQLSLFKSYIEFIIL